MWTPEAADRDWSVWVAQNRDTTGRRLFADKKDAGDDEKDHHHWLEEDWRAADVDYHHPAAALDSRIPTRRKRTPA